MNTEHGLPAWYKGLYDYLSSIPDIASDAPSPILPLYIYEAITKYVEACMDSFNPFKQNIKVMSLTWKMNYCSSFSS
jgi:hypothetical protein